MFIIDNHSRRPIYEQLIEQFEKFILNGALPADTKIPSVRGLSVTLSINPNTIQKAYSELDARGLIYSLPGKGSYISPDAAAKLGNSRLSLIGDIEPIFIKLKDAGIDKSTVNDLIDKIWHDQKEDNK